MQSSKKAVFAASMEDDERGCSCPECCDEDDDDSIMEWDLPGYKSKAYPADDDDVMEWDVVHHDNNNRGDSNPPEEDEQDDSPLTPTELKDLFEYGVACYATAIRNNEDQEEETALLYAALMRLGRSLVVSAPSPSRR